MVTNYGRRVKIHYSTRKKKGGRMEFDLANLIITIVMLISAQIVTTKWIRADLVKQEKIHEEFVRESTEIIKEVKGNIHDLYDRTHHMLRREEIENVVKGELGPLRDSMTSITQDIGILTESVNELTTTIAVMSALNERDHNERKNRRAGDDKEA